MRASLAAAGVLAAIGSWASPADAQEVAAEARGTKANVEAEIVVVAERPDQARIDRRIYTIADDPIAQSTDMFEALGRIPSVSVTPDGAITLLGAGGVTVQINGQPAPAGNLEQILRGLQGAQVERIEVITNPSAQLSAQTSGGVINIITRRRVEAGFNGSASLGVNSAQGYLVNAGPSWSRGPWSVSVWAGLGHNESDRPYGRVRRDASGAILTSEAGESDSDTDSAYAWAQVGYKPDDRHRLTLSANAFDGSTATLQRAQRRDALDPAFDQLRITDDDTGYRAASVAFERDGDAEREKTTLNLKVDRNVRDGDQAALQSRDGLAFGRIATRNADETVTLSSKLDYERPFGERRVLSLGAAADLRRYAADGTSLSPVTGPPGAGGFDTGLRARDQTLAAYGTHQIEAKRWTFLPGVRFEAYRREVIGVGGETDGADARAFPTAHLRRKLGDTLDFDLSYASRIDRPALDRLDPTIRVIDADRALRGNPDLRPTTIDAFEANLNWRREGRTFSLTAFDRISSDVISPFTQQVGPVTIYTEVNAGRRDERGLQVIWRGPIANGWRYSLTGSAVNITFDMLDGGEFRRGSELEYSSQVQLEYRAEDQARVGATNFAVDLRFNGPRYRVQGETEPSSQVNLTWRRRLTPKVFGVFIVQDVFSGQDSISTVTTDTFTERTETLSQGVRLRLSLTYQWGAGSDTMQDRSRPDGGGSSS